jgi:hypothetical protein
VKTEERTKVEFPGILGGFVKTFGGKGAREGVTSKVALKGDRKMTVNDETAQIVDLAEEKIYELDMKKKTYTVITFEQMRRQIQEAMEKAKAQAAKTPAAPQPQPTNNENKDTNLAIDFKVENSGQTAKINGFDCREVVATITVRQKDKKAEEGAMVVTASMWLAPRIAAVKELEDFDLRVAQKLYLPMAQSMAADMAPALAAYPGLTDALKKLELEKVNMDGSAIRTIVRADFLGSDSQAPAAKPVEEKKQQEIPKSLGGLLGGLGRRAAARNDEAPKNETGRASFMTSTTELLSVSTTVSDSEVAIPAGFKAK